jgi:uncharacterized membrane protein
MPGTKNMFIGSGFAILGLLITGITYATAPGGFFVIAYGAVFVGVVQFIYGLFQYVFYYLKSPAAKAKVHADATVTAICRP